MAPFGCTGALLAAVGDVMAQSADSELSGPSDGQEAALGNTNLNIDWQRFLGFVAFGALVKGIGQHYIYGKIHER